MDNIQLFGAKKDCCGCGACMNVCPKNAISMEEDAYGFLYPKIDHEICIRCGQCKKVCGYQKKDPLPLPQEVYAAESSLKDVSRNAASGGIFGTLAYEILIGKGVVYGCAYEHREGALVASHIRVDNIEDLARLQGSKYVQSDMDIVFREIRDDLIKDKTVLFSGTPCQVDAVKHYINSCRVHKGCLYTVDIICHGVPSARFFKDYMVSLSGKLNGKITDFKFRDKTNGWGLKAGVYYIDHRQKERKRLIPVQLSSYYSIFLKSYSYRENCYSCKYAGRNRVGDITIGDYWGIEKVHPEYLKENGGNLDSEIGISCLLVNTDKGEKLVHNYGKNLVLCDSTIENAAFQNEQLNAPCKEADERNTVLELYRTGSYGAVEKWYSKIIGNKKYVYMLWNGLPRSVQLFLKKALPF